jgi:hypothetical protein
MLCQGFLVLFNSTFDTIIAGMMLSIVYMKLVQVLKPYVDDELNRMKEISLWQIFFVFFLALLIKMDNYDNWALTLFVVVVFFAYFILAVMRYMLSCCWKQHAGIMERVSGSTTVAEPDQQKVKTGIEMNRLVSQVPPPVYKNKTMPMTHSSIALTIASETAIVQSPIHTSTTSDDSGRSSAAVEV